MNHRESELSLHETRLTNYTACKFEGAEADFLRLLALLPWSKTLSVSWTRLTLAIFCRTVPGGTYAHRFGFLCDRGSI